MKITIIKIIQHGFYRGQDTNVFTVKPEIVKEFIEKKIREKYDFLGKELTQDAIYEFISDVMKYQRCKYSFCTGEGDFEVMTKTVDYIETL